MLKMTGAWKYVMARCCAVSLFSVYLWLQKTIEGSQLAALEYTFFLPLMFLCRKFHKSLLHLYPILPAPYPSDNPVRQVRLTGSVLHISYPMNVQ